MKTTTAEAVCVTGQLSVGGFDRDRMASNGDPRDKIGHMRKPVDESRNVAIFKVILTIGKMLSQC